MWVLARFGFAGLVFIFRALWRRKGVDQSVHYRDTRRVTWAKYTTTGPRENRQRVVAKIYWGLALKTPLVFALTREGWWDRVCKALGVATELETGDAEFDRKIYVAGDHPALHRLLAADAGLRERIVGLFARGAVRVFSDGRHLWVESAELAYPSERELDELYRIYVALRDGGPARGHWILDTFLWKAVVVEALVWSAALYGVPALVEQLYREYVRGEGQRYLDLWALAQAGLVLAAAVFVVLVGLIIVWLHGSSRGHRIIAESVIVLGLGLPFSATEVVSDFNISRDSSAPRQYEYRVVEKWDTDGPRRSRRRWRSEDYFLTLAPVTAGAPTVRPFLKVTAKQYHGVEKGGLVRITSRAGRLEIPWIVRFEVP
jgi:hypothetical protein